jgi:hypothetical protein
MSLTGRSVQDAARNYKTIEGRALLAAVREFLRLLDEEMKKPSSVYRGQRVGQLSNALELAADRYDLFGEKDRRKIQEERTK